MDLVTQSGTKITIEATPFARGGEGTVHRITSPSTLSNCCVKLYYEKLILGELGKQKMQKIQFMTQNPPVNWQNKNYILCWPLELVFQNGDFLGFMMPLAFSDSVLLYELCSMTINANVGKDWTKKYDRGSWDGLNSRLKLCTNIASAIHDIHSLQKYVVVDLKPENILITDDGKVSVVDCDSLQIADQGKVLFHAPVATEEYSPPEGMRMKIQPSKNLIHESWDRFSLAVIFYKVIFGLHPYTATFGGQYANVGNIPPKIKNGLFVHGQNKNQIVVLPAPHNNYHLLPGTLRALFERAFEGGNVNPTTRPSAEMWGIALYKAVTQSQLPKSGFSVHTPTVRKTRKGKAFRIPKTFQTTRTHTSNKKGNIPSLIGLLLLSGWLIYMGWPFISGVFSPPPVFEITGKFNGAINNRNSDMKKIKLDVLNFEMLIPHIGYEADISPEGKFHFSFDKKLPAGVYAIQTYYNGRDRNAHLILDGKESSIIFQANIEDLSPDGYHELTQSQYQIHGSESSSTYQKTLSALKSGEMSQVDIMKFIDTTSNSLNAAMIAIHAFGEKNTDHADAYKKVFIRLKSQYPNSSFAEQYLECVSPSPPTNYDRLKTVVIPDFVCLTDEEANALAKIYGLQTTRENVDIKFNGFYSTKDLNDSLYGHYYVEKQEPPYVPGRSTEQFSFIRLYLTETKPNHCN